MTLIRRLVRMACIVGSLPILSCDDISRYELVWKDTSAIALTEGYTDYQGERNLTDYGVVVFSYAFRPGTRPLEELRRRITTEYPCYEVVEESNTRLVLRCRDRKSRQPEEWGFLLDEERSRMFVLRMWDVPRSDVRHKELMEALDEAKPLYTPRAHRSP
jgi:hypothetical protein